MSNSQDTHTRAFELLQYGRLVVTATSKQTGKHITLRFRCKSRELKKRHVKLDEAKIIGIDAGRVINENEYSGGDMVAYCFADRIRSRRMVHLTPNRDADTARVWTAQKIIDWIVTGKLHPQLELRLEGFCARCGRQLADPQSVDRGVGPECYGKLTDSQHQLKYTVPKPDQAALDI